MQCGDGYRQSERMRKRISKLTRHRWFLNKAGSWAAGGVRLWVWDNHRPGQREKEREEVTYLAKVTHEQNG